MGTRKKFYLLSVAIFITFAFNGCDSPEYIEEDSYITGDITRISSDELQGQKKILVEEDTSVHEPLAPNGKKVLFRVTKDTEFLIRKKDGNLHESTFENLVVGQKVEGWVGRVIIDTDPAQGKAKRIVVVKE